MYTAILQDIPLHYERRGGLGQSYPSRINMYRSLEGYSGRQVARIVRIKLNLIKITLQLLGFVVYKDSKPYSPNNGG
ncbi:MAG TPA: hypothetical protein V6D33_18955 [Cyanophyceae cyanobacterium]